MPDHHRLPIDPALRHYLDEGVATATNLSALSDAERVDAVRANAMRSLETRRSIAGLPNGATSQDVEIAPGLWVRLYTPSDARSKLPLLVYLHGGGWVAGSVVTLDPFCRLLCQEAGIVIASVEFRRAPEHPYPDPVEDAVQAVHWAAQEAAEYGADPSRLALGGDSAGGNLAAVAANRLCTGPNAPRLAALLLLYPVTDHPSACHPSYAENATGYGLDASSMRWFWDQYASAVSPANPEISPLRLVQVPRLPPTLVATAEYDVLRDEGIAYVEKLRAAGVSVTHHHAPDMHHNFPVGPATVARFPQCDDARLAFARWLQETLWL